MPLKTALITGCGPDGLGSALAKELHLRGHHVFATGRTAEDLDPHLKELGLPTLILDVTSQPSIDAAVSAVRAANKGTGSGLDILVNNAGLVHVMPFTDADVSDLRRLLDVNVVGVWAVTRAFLPLLMDGQGGVVATVGSINEGLCPPFFAAYNMSKAAVTAMGRTLRRELAPLGVRVVTIKTGVMNTRLFGNDTATLPEGSLYEPIRDILDTRKFREGVWETAPEVWGKSVADELLKPEPRAVFWTGALTFIAWVLSWLGWETMLVGSRRPMFIGYGY